MYHTEGRVKFTEEGTLQYEYAIRDHLANTRVYFTDADEDGVPEVLQREDYYPFDLTHQGTPFQFLQKDKLTENTYLYNNKEMNTDLGLNWLDYGARFYDAALGRWHVVDPLVEVYYDWSPYNYAVNNPIYFIDKDGMGPEEGTIHTEGHIEVSVIVASETVKQSWMSKFISTYTEMLGRGSYGKEYESDRSKRGRKFYLYQNSGGDNITDTNDDSNFITKGEVITETGVTDGIEDNVSVDIDFTDNVIYSSSQESKEDANTVSNKLTKITVSATVNIDQTEGVNVTLSAGLPGGTGIEDNYEFGKNDKGRTVTVTAILVVDVSDGTLISANSRNDSASNSVPFATVHDPATNTTYTLYFQYSNQHKDSKEDD